MGGTHVSLTQAECLLVRERDRGRLVGKDNSQVTGTTPFPRAAFGDHSDSISARSSFLTVHFVAANTRQEGRSDIVFQS